MMMVCWSGGDDAICTEGHDDEHVSGEPASSCRLILGRLHDCVDCNRSPLYPLLSEGEGEDLYLGSTLVRYPAASSRALDTKRASNGLELCNLSSYSYIASNSYIDSKS